MDIPLSTLALLGTTVERYNGFDHSHFQSVFGLLSKRSFNAVVSFPTNVLHKQGGLYLLEHEGRLYARIHPNHEYLLDNLALVHLDLVYDPDVGEIILLIVLNKPNGPSDMCLWARKPDMAASAASNDNASVWATEQSTFPHPYLPLGVTHVIQGLVLGLCAEAVASPSRAMINPFVGQPTVFEAEGELILKNEQQTVHRIGPTPWNWKKLPSNSLTPAQLVILSSLYEQELVTMNKNALVALLDSKGLSRDERHKVLQTIDSMTLQGWFHHPDSKTISPSPKLINALT